MRKTSHADRTAARTASPAPRADAHGAVTVPRPAPEAAARLFLFHHAGGSQLLYRGWERAFPADWELCLVDAPGRGRLLGRPLIGTCDQLVDFFRAELEPWTDRPFAFFGHSMGALVAYELTRRLVREGRPLPSWIGLSACGAPGTARSSRDRHAWTDGQLRDWLGSVGGTPAKVLDDERLWRLFGPIFRNDFALVDTWRPDPGTTPLPVPLSAFGGTEDELVGRARLAAWAAHSQEFRGLHMMSGGHFYLRHHGRSIARHIIAAMTAPA
ncbi:thioesterase II family protein [Streptomyces cavernicola]|uniref:Thioesterase domain-containing protein n=1 Tax=Streptomyces cavernicola TaxID=3043613 RepID=A0ABT6SJ35_9ACTN|nr:thioesterase domain-containing protein [Streptomyces sp. B-S-A6]MDI3408212.1 thioesterase domain-containing protein [Streptomyces sp. B-S-A6]